MVHKIIRSGIRQLSSKSVSPLALFNQEQEQAIICNNFEFCSFFHHEETKKLPIMYRGSYEG